MAFSDCFVVHEGTYQGTASEEPLREYRLVKAESATTVTIHYASGDVSIGLNANQVIKVWGGDATVSCSALTEVTLS
jgi:hypothetical protein